jgi:hypothetical protein
VSIGRSVGLQVPCLMLALAATAGQLPADSPSAGGLQFSLRIEGQSYVLGEPVLVTVAWKNASGDSIQVKDWLGWQSDAFSVYRGSKRLDYRCLCIDYVAGPPSRVLGPQQEYSETIDLSQCYDLLSEGAYTVRAEYVADPAAHDARGQSARVDIALRRASERELARFRPLAAEGDLFAIRVLGAHRDTMAVPALQKAVESASEDVRGDATVALARIGTADAIDVLRGRSARETDFVLLTAIREILRHPGVETPLLKELLAVPLYPPPRRGLTWGRVAHDKKLGTDLVSCHGAPRPEGGDCDAHEGDTLCTEQLPILCLKRDGSARPNYALVGTAHSMPREYYQGWAGGRIALTRPVRGTNLTSLAAADAICAQALGKGYRMAEFHDGKYVVGMGEQRLHGKLWPKDDALASGGWAFHARGKVKGTTRFWVSINDQPANCWNPERSTGP